MLAMIAESGSDAATGIAVTLSGTLVLLGAFLKNRTPLNPGWIPLVLLILAIPSYIIMTWPVDFTGVVMAVYTALGAIGLHGATKSSNQAATEGLRDPLKPKPTKK